MEIGQKFNKLTLKEYYFYIDNHKKYTDFNTLGLYRSIIENEKLNLEEKLQVRDYAHLIFRKSFDFLQLKDPSTFVDVEYLGQDLTKADEVGIWDDLRKNQQKILESKKIKHRNFGIYSKHNCGYDDCNWNGVMIRQGSRMAERFMHFHSDKNEWSKFDKASRKREERKTEKHLIEKEIDLSF